MHMREDCLASAMSAWGYRARFVGISVFVGQSKSDLP